MTTLHAYIDGIGLLGPGLTGWPQGRAVLSGAESYAAAKTALPAPAMLPAAERRRSGPLVRVALAVGAEAGAGHDLARLATVFTSSGGDGVNCHELCEMLASNDRQVSPTRFHNSVHNAAAGYWSIAAGAMETASVLCAHDGSFGAGLLEALAQVAVDGVPVLLIAADTAYPEPLHAARPIPDEFAIGLLLSPRQRPQSIARIGAALSGLPPTAMAEPGLETLRGAIPAARSLPLLDAIAHGAAAHLVLDYLEHSRLAVDVAPCAPAA
ncbi:MAG: 3-oxoacyl-[ACP] synthase [Burkholderia sp.]|nr:3-oxoacyl-[ACP] synthase [Burkholderia sp.]